MGIQNTNVLVCQPTDDDYSDTKEHFDEVQVEAVHHIRTLSFVVLRPERRLRSLACRTIAERWDGGMGRQVQADPSMCAVVVDQTVLCSCWREKTKEREKMFGRSVVQSVRRSEKPTNIGRIKDDVMNVFEAVVKDFQRSPSKKKTVMKRCKANQY